MFEVVVLQLRTTATFAELFFRQDREPHHYALAIRDYINQTFPLRLLGRRGNIEWPPHSPDVTSIDFFFVDVVKNNIYERNNQTVDELKLYIEVFLLKWLQIGIYVVLYVIVFWRGSRNIAVLKEDILTA